MRCGMISALFLVAEVLPEKAPFLHIAIPPVGFAKAHDQIHMLFRYGIFPKVFGKVILLNERVGTGQQIPDTVNEKF